MKKLVEPVVANDGTVMCTCSSSEFTLHRTIRLSHDMDRNTEEEGLVFNDAGWDDMVDEIESVVMCSGCSREVNTARIHLELE